MGGGVHFNVGDPPIIPQQCDSCEYKGGGLQRPPTICFSSQKLRLGFVKNHSFSGQLQHFLESKLRLFQF